MSEFVWINNTRSLRRVFSGRSGFTLVRYDGLSLPGKDHLAARGPRQHGATYVATYFQPRQFSLEVAIAGCDMEELQAKHRTLAAAINPLDASELRVVAEDGSRYYLTCRPVTSVAWRVADGRVAEALIQCVADDPFFYSMNQQSVAILTALVSLTIPFTIPARIGGYLDDVSVTNNGQVFAYPVLVFNGPATNIHMFNNTTGEDLQVNEVVAGGEVLTVDMGARTALVDAGLPTERNVVGGAVGDWWALQPGVNDLTFTNENAAAVSGTLTFRERFLAVV